MHASPHTQVLPLPFLPHFRYITVLPRPPPPPGAVERHFPDLDSVAPLSGVPRLAPVPRSPALKDALNIM